jgi:sugar/nucleoside kinase (ribokinase family)
MFDVVTIGTATRDVFLTSTAFKVLKDPKHLQKIGFPKGEAACMALGSKIEVREPIFTTGGGAANAAVSFARQGLKTAAIIKVGEDDAGSSVLENLKREGVKTLATRSKKGPTAYSTVLITEGGERTILVYRAEDELFERDIPFNSFSARWAYCSPGNISFPLMQKIIIALKKKGIKLALNPSQSYLAHPNSLKPILRHADAVILNQEEAAKLTGVPYAKEAKILEAFFAMVENGVALMTQDVRGAIACDGGYIYRVGAFSNVKAIDETGAGDAFAAGFIAGLTETDDMLYALRLAAANAASVVEHVGATTGALTPRQFKSPRWAEISLDIEER